MIKGLVRAHPIDMRIENMMVGESAYLAPDDIIVTRNAIYIDRYAPVITIEMEIEEDDEDDEGMPSDTITIKRIGRGLTGNDFELDFTAHTDYLPLEGDAMAIALSREIEMYIVFNDFTISLREHKKPKVKKVDYTKMSTEKLKDLMQEYSDKQDYPKAAEVKRVLDERELIEKR